MPSPTYHNIGDHTETVQVDYDPNLTSYGQLLDVFWNSHEPTRRSRPGQYMKAVFYQNEQQRELALASKVAVEKKIGSTVKTEIVPLQAFTMAEDYHQKFTLKGHKGLKKEMEDLTAGTQTFFKQRRFNMKRSRKIVCVRTRETIMLEGLRLP